MRLILILLFAVSALGGPRESLLVDAKWLAAHLGDPDLVLLHVGDKDEYTAKHIPGARFVSLRDISVSNHPDGLALEIPPDLRERLENLGISNKSRVVVYYGKDWVSPATRVIFTLDYAGLGDRTTLLDGGMPAWIAAGNAVTDAVPPERKGKLSPLKTRPLVVDAKFVRAHLRSNGYVIVDGRNGSFYDGVETGGMHDHMHKTGHIAGARSVPFSEIVDDKNVVRSPDELRALFAKAGVKPGDTVVGYCHI